MAEDVFEGHVRPEPQGPQGPSADGQRSGPRTDRPRMDGGGGGRGRYVSQIGEKQVLELNKEDRMKQQKHPIYAMSFARVYPLYVAKAEKKGRTKAEVDEIIRWLTGYDQGELMAHLEKRTDLETFITEAPRPNPCRAFIKGAICGVRVEDIEEPMMREIRYMDKLIDELAKGKAMEKILRKE